MKDLGNFVKVEGDWEASVKYALEKNKGLTWTVGGVVKWLSNTELKAKYSKSRTTKQLEKSSSPSNTNTMKLFNNATLPSKDFSGNLNKILDSLGYSGVIDWLKAEINKNKE